MKRTVLLFIFLSTCFIRSVLSQNTPEAIPYQAVARDNGQPMANQAIQIKVEIVENDMINGNVLYAESHNAISNEFGLIQFHIGNGSVLSGNFSGINWGASSKFIRIYKNTNGSWESLGSSPLLSVPFALHSKKTDNIQFVVSEVADTLYIGESGNFIIVPGISSANDMVVNGPIGCTQPTACNYNPNASTDNGSCLFPGTLCNDQNPATQNDVITEQCTCAGDYIILGCTNPLACNYLSVATVDNGTCLVANATCNDNNSNTVDDVVDQNCVCAGTLTGTGNGLTLLPNNATCANETISTTGCGGQTSITYFGLTYDLVEIGGQCWFADNLATIQFRDGTAIPNVTDATIWGANAALTSPAFCWYFNNSVNQTTYGALYNWATVNTGNLCPVGWHVPTDCDWMYLEKNIGLPANLHEITAWRGDVGGKLKLASGFINSYGATNTTGFSAIGSGSRSNGGTFTELNNYGFYWTSTNEDSANAMMRGVAAGSVSIYRDGLGKKYGFSVRCLKN